MSFAVRDDIVQLVFGRGRDFFRDERWPAKVAPFGIFPMTLRAVADKTRIRDEGCVRRRGLAESCVKHEEGETQCDCKVGCFQVEPR